MRTPIVPKVAVQAAPFDVGVEIDRLISGRTDFGASVVFTGHCRDEGGRIAALELEHYPGMAEKELERIAREAATRWPIAGLTIMHRTGKVVPGEVIVVVIAIAEHRREALKATEFIMDFLKTDAPFWKKEHLPDGTSTDWVAPKQADDRARASWGRE
jgi:molybdopterin synthase catalytic subunit